MLSRCCTESAPPWVLITRPNRARSLMSLQFLSSGFNLLRLGGYFKEFAWGLLLVVVLSVNFFVDAYRRKKSVKAMGRRARLDRQKAAT